MICDQEKPLVVDHCHKSGVVRGLLCDRCNSGVGLFCDNPRTMDFAAKYLESNEMPNFTGAWCD